MNKFVAMICAGLVMGLAPAASAGETDVSSSSNKGAGYDCNDLIAPTETFAVKVRALDDEYRIGETALFRVRVNRVLEGQDLGPVEGADVAVGVDLGEVYLRSGGVTDSRGRAVVEVTLERYVPAVWADVTASASRLIAIHTPCHSQLEEEYGSVEEQDLFKIVR